MSICLIGCRSGLDFLIGFTAPGVIASHLQLQLAACARQIFTLHKTARDSVLCTLGGPNGALTHTGILVMERMELSETFFCQELVYGPPTTMPWGMHPPPCPRCLEKGQESQSKPYHVKSSQNHLVVHIQCSVCCCRVKAGVGRPSFVQDSGSSMLNHHYWLPFPRPVAYAGLEWVSMKPSMHGGMQG